MGEVATEIRALQIFETFARLRRPLRLSELAGELDMPVSSCFTLVRRLIAEGHLFEPVEKRGYYPTGKLRGWTATIAAHDPIVQRVEPVIETLRDRSGETATFSRLTGTSVICVAAAESLNPIRMAGRVGVTRPAHAVSAGKALLSTLSAKDRAEVMKKHRFERITPATRTSMAELEADILDGAQLGHFISREECIEGAMAVSAPVTLAGQAYAIQVAGPVGRVEANLTAILASLREAAATLDEQYELAARA